MVDKKDSKETTRKIYEVLPKLDDHRCGYKTCGEFARAVTDGKAPCYGCVSGGPEVVPEEAIPQFGPSPGFYQPGLSGGRGMGRGMGQGFSRGRGRGRGFGQGRRGR